MLPTIHQFATSLNQYANLLMAFATIFLVVLTAIYVGLTSRTLKALNEASLREREAHHLQEIKDYVIQPIIFWIKGTLFERFAGGSPQILTISGGYDGKSRHCIHTIDDPFTARHRLNCPSDADVPDPLTIWSSTDSGRISMFLYNHAKRDHFPQELPEFDRLLHEVRQLTGAIMSFVNDSAKDIASPEIPQALRPEDENIMSEWTNPYLLAADCTNSFLQGKEDPVFTLGSFPGFYLLATRRNQTVARAAQPDKLKHWSELGLKHVRKQWEHSDLPERVKNLLENADGVRQRMDQLLFTHSLGVDCELVSGKKRRR